MMASYIVGTESKGCDRFAGRLPSVFEIQDFIEEAWASTLWDASRRAASGGTRKYIGTSEAQAVFCNLEIP